MQQEENTSQNFYKNFNTNEETPTTVRALVVFAWLILCVGLLLAIVSFFLGINASRDLKGEEIYKSFIVWQYMLFALSAAFFSTFLFYAVKGFAIMVKSIHKIANRK
ncbi:MAG: hypothetical protein IKO42_04620 [Opitutales bacterium]|nr:hypothetical protein [Opitutales bacterium]